MDTQPVGCPSYDVAVHHGDRSREQASRGLNKASNLCLQEQQVGKWETGIWVPFLGHKYKSSFPSFIEMELRCDALSV